MLNAIWNQKFSGIISALLQLIEISYKRALSFITTKLFLWNISSNGANIKVSYGLTYRYPSKIFLHSNVMIGSNVSLTSENIESKQLYLHNGVSIGDNCKIDFSGGVVINENAHLAHNVTIISHDHGYDYRMSPIPKSLDIGANTFIGSNVMILHNCHRIGKGAVIGSGSIVTKDVPDYAVVAGNPAKILRFIQ